MTKVYLYLLGALSLLAKPSNLFAQSDHSIEGEWIRRIYTSGHLNFQDDPRDMSFYVYKFSENGKGFICCDPFERGDSLNYKILNNELQFGGQVFHVDSLTEELLILSYALRNKVNKILFFKIVQNNN